MREYLNVYEESISQIAGVRLPPFDIKDIINSSLGMNLQLIFLIYELKVGCTFRIQFACPNSIFR